MTSQTANDTNSWTGAQTQRRVNPLSVNEWVSEWSIDSFMWSESEWTVFQRGTGPRHQTPVWSCLPAGRHAYV